MSNLDAMVVQQITYAYGNAPAIRKIMDEAGVSPSDIQTTGDLAKIPVTSKDQLVAMQQEDPPFGGFVTVSVGQLQRIYLSPGPIYDPHGFGDEAAENAMREAFTEAHFSAEDIVLNTFLYHMVPAGLLMDQAMQLLGATVVPMGPGNTEIQIKVILDVGCTAYLGTPSFLQMIYDKADGMGIPPNALPLKKAFFSAEPYTSSQRAKFEGEYGLTTAQAYATADLGVIGYEIPGKQGLYIPSNLVVQVCSPEDGSLVEDGELGEVVVTSMNPTYPLIRFGTGDLSIMEMDGDRRKLKGWMGRSGEAIKVRGMFLHPNNLTATLGQFENIKKFQAVVGRDGTRDTVRLEVILSEGDIDADAVIAAAKTAARLSINEVAVVDEIEGARTVRDTRKFD